MKMLIKLIVAPVFLYAFSGATTAEALQRPALVSQGPAQLDTRKSGTRSEVTAIQICELQVPELDERSYEETLRKSRKRIPVHSPEWSKHNKSRQTPEWGPSVDKMPGQNRFDDKKTRHRIPTGTDNSAGEK